MHNLIVIRHKYVAAGGGLINFSLTNEANDLADQWWDGSKSTYPQVLNATYRYKKTPPKMVSTGNLIHLYSEDLIKIICSHEEYVQIIPFIVNGANADYEYYAIKCLNNLDIFNRDRSEFGTDYSLKLLAISGVTSSKRGFYRIKGIENHQFVSSDLADELINIADGSYNFIELPTHYVR